MNRKELGESLNLSEELVPAGRRNRPGIPIRPTSVTMHNTSNSNPGADADAHSRMVRTKGYYELPSGKKQWVSWHYTVDDKKVIKQLPTSELAYHAGPANDRSIAIEICMHAGIDQSAANARAARLVAALLYDHGWGIGAVKSHKDWTNKDCPKKLLPQFAAFKNNVEAIRSSITAGIVPPGIGVAAEALSEAYDAGDAAGEGEIPQEALDAEIDHDLLVEQWSDHVGSDR